MVKRIGGTIFLPILTVLFAPPVSATIVPIESPTFYGDSPQVAISPDQLTATFVESPDFTPVVLSSDQPWGATGIAATPQCRCLVV